jgi:hypothetical protein
MFFYFEAHTLELTIPTKASSLYPLRNCARITNHTKRSLYNLKNDTPLVLAQQLTYYSSIYTTTKVMSSTRTIFIENGLPIFEDHTPSTGQAWWVSVKFLACEKEISDENLMNIAIKRLSFGSGQITQGVPMHHQQPLCVSFPVDLSLPEDRWVPYAVKYAEQYKREIAAGNVSIDSEYVFGSRKPGPGKF